MMCRLRLLYVDGSLDPEYAVVDVQPRCTTEHDIDFQFEGDHPLVAKAFGDRWAMTDEHDEMIVWVRMGAYCPGDTVTLSGATAQRSRRRVRGRHRRQR